MKKRTSLLTALLALTLSFLLAFAAPLAAIAGELTVSKYDVDGNSTIEISDVTALINSLGGEGGVDLNNDGASNIGDVTALLNYLTGNYTAADIVEGAYELEAGATTDDAYTLTGTVTSIDTPYAAQYGNITVTIVVDNMPNNPIQCYRMKGTNGVDVSLVGVGDVITVTGKLKNYVKNDVSTIEFDTGCLCSAIVFTSDVRAALANVVFASEYESGDETEAYDYDPEYDGVTLSYSFSENAPATYDGDLITFGQVSAPTVMTITVTATKDNDTASKSFTVTVNPSNFSETMEDIVNAAYELETGSSLPTEKTLTGKIVSIDTAYSEQYGNITVTIVVGTLTDKPIQCYRMVGAAATENTDAVDISGLVVGDTITVTGTLKRFSATKVEFDAACVCTEVIENHAARMLEEIDFPDTVNSGDEDEIVSTMEGVSFTYTFATATGANAPVTVANGVLTYGQVSESTQITVTVTAAYENDTATKTFSVTILPAGASETMEDIVLAAYALGTGESMSEAKTLTGVITVINTPYAANYKNITVTIVVGDLTDKPIQCYRLKNGADFSDDEGVAVLKVGDTITVTGTLKNYNGTIEFNTGCTLDALEPYQMTDEDKVQAECDALSVTFSDGAQLPTSGATYSDVEIEWESDNDMVSVDNATVSINNTLQEGDNPVTVTVTATVWLGDVEMTKDFTVTLNPPSNESSWTLTFPDYNDKGVGSYTAEWTATVNGQVWSIANFNNNTNGWAYIKCSNKNNSGTATISTTISGTVAEFVVSASKMGYATGLTLTVANGDTVLTTINGSTDAGDQTISIPEAYQGQGYTYTLTFSFDNTSGTNGTIWVESVTANSESGATPATCDHTYGTPTYTWAANHSTCTATAVCTLCGDTVTETVQATTEQAVTFNGTIYTATFTNALFETQTYNEPVGNETSFVLTFPDYNDSNVGAYTAAWTATVSGHVWTLTNFNNNNSAWAYVKCGRKNVESVATIATDVDGKVLTVSVTIDSLTAANVNSIKLIVTSGNDAKTYILDKEAGTQTVTILAADQFNSATYTLEFDCAAGSGNGLVTVSQVEITLGEGGTTGTSPFDPSACNHTYGEVTYDWADDYSTCTATRTCTICGNVETETVQTTSEPAVAFNGTIYTATFTNPAFYIATNNVYASSGNEQTDVLTAALFAATSTTYTEFSGVTATSGAVYAGQSAMTSGGAIQLRSKNSNSGIVTTTSGGKIVSITVTFESGSNTLDIYGSNTAYTSAADLYSSSTQGTKIGSISADGTVTIEGDYAYIGLRSNNGALYITSIEIVWDE